MSDTGRILLDFEGDRRAIHDYEQAGGYASDGTRCILDVEPKELHQRSPLFIGSRDDVKHAEELLRA